MGNAKLFNTLILGAYLKVRPIVEMEYVMQGLKKSLPERAWKMLPENERAIIHGGGDYKAPLPIEHLQRGAPHELWGSSHV